VLRIGILGDFNSKFDTHRATDQALALAGTALDVEISAEWIPTRNIAPTNLREYQALIIGTGLYDDREAVLAGVQEAREQRIPTLGACGGFQHMILEYARNVLGLKNPGHAEFDTDTSEHVIVPLECSLWGSEGEISLDPSSQAGMLYPESTATESFYCSFGVSPACSELLHKSPLRVAGTDAQGLIRVTELPGHPFFIGTLFVPQARALQGKSHPLVEGFVRCAVEHR
jgi:CTP synthase (UTP-ammonia lyase)